MGDPNSFDYTLPTKGIYYDGKLPGGVIQLRPLTTKEEAILYSDSMDLQERMRKILDSCIVNRAVPSDEFLLTDRFGILLALRVNAFGPSYDFKTRCGFCKQTYKAHSDVREFPELEIPEGSTEPFEEELEKGIKVRFRALRGKDEMAIYRTAKRINMANSADASDPSFILNLASRILAINDEELSTLQAENHVKDWRLKVTNAFRKAYLLVEGGVNTTCYTKCKACGSEEEVALPFDPSFFRPD